MTPFAKLQPGASISVVAPSGPFDEEDFKRGLSLIESRGFRCRLTKDLGQRTRYLAGGDTHRLESLKSAFLDKDTAAVWCARGGYGAMRLLPRLQWAELPVKPLVGFSDATALHASALRAGRMGIHGPVITQLGRQPKSAADRVFALLEGRSVPTLTGARSVQPGRVKGPLVGGNMVVLTRLLGTPWFPDLRGAILLLEEVAERPYRLDRMWTHLRLAGALDGVAGVAVGSLDRCEEPGAPYTAEDVMADLLRELSVPSAIGFPIGHNGENHAVVLGLDAQLDASAGTLEQK